MRFIFMPEKVSKKQNEIDDIFDKTEPAPKIQSVSGLKRTKRVISNDLGGQESTLRSENLNDSGGSGLGKKMLIIAAVAIIILIGAALFWFLLNKLPAGNSGINNVGSINQVQSNGKSLKNTNSNYVNQKIDTDSDGLTNEEEKKLGTDPDKADSDNDLLLDNEEVKNYQTDPLNQDTDGDGYKDGEEVKTGNNPKGPGRLFEVPKE